MESGVLERHVPVNPFGLGDKTTMPMAQSRITNNKWSHRNFKEWNLL